jgi:hypothetical protein
MPEEPSTSSTPATPLGPDGTHTPPVGATSVALLDGLQLDDYWGQSSN